jgi:hypothetical protein
MSGFLNSIVRGAGMSIGRNLVGDFGRSKKSTTSSTSNRYYDRAENEMEKALNFQIKGKSETILENCFNMYQAFDDECNSLNRGTTALLLRTNRMRYYKECLEKIKDCKEFLEFKNSNDENITKLDNLWDKVNFVLFDYVKSLSESILLLETSKDKETARGAWFGYSDGFNSSTPLNKVYPQIQSINPEQYNENLIIEIENHLKAKSFFSKLFK